MQVLLSQEQGHGNGSRNLVFLGGKMRGSLEECPVSQLHLRDRSALAILDMVG